MLNMIRASLLLMAFGTTALSAQTPAAPAQAAAAPVKATAKNAASFLGDWDLSGEGSNGPASFMLSAKAQGDALATVLTNSSNEPQTVDDVSMVGSSLALNVTFYNQGTGYPATLTLTPSGDKVLLHIEVAGGLAQLDGTATKKPAKP